MRIHRALRRDIDSWVGQGAPAGSLVARRIRLNVLHQQRTTRVLVRDLPLARRTLRLMSGPARDFLISNLRAGTALRRLSVPVKGKVTLKPSVPAPPQKLRRYYEVAERRFGVPWHLLAAVNFVESRFGRILGPSSAGALGPMQFLPSTWEQYGGGGDIMDARDAILGAARYLAASGALTDERGALFAYNRSFDYVDAIQAYARQIERTPWSFYNYYFWQVFVATTRGDVQLTGPGAGLRPNG
jgi:soluble lytic murein transglycosylase-like protein